jgi:cyanophycinase
MRYIILVLILSTLFSYVYFLVRRHWRLFNFVIWNPKYSWMLGAPLLLGISCAGKIAGFNRIANGSLPCSASLGITGDPSDVQTKTEPGLLLAGGSTDVEAAMKWFLERSGGGDVVILRASGSTGYNDFLYKLGKVNSVETLLINSKALAQNDTVVQIVRNAEALFIAGGDQWNYTQYWMGTPLNEAINYLINKKKVPVGGTSAGLAILGEYFFDARYDGITSDTALQNPMHKKMSVNKGFIQSKYLANLITDSHYDQRNRQGRHVVMLADILQKQKKPATGLGVDEKTAVSIDEKGNLIVFGSNRAWWLKSSAVQPEIFENGKPITWIAGKRAVAYFTIMATSSGTPAGNIRKMKLENFEQTGYMWVADGKLTILPKPK